MVVAAMEELSLAYDSFASENQIDSVGIADLRNKLATYYSNDFSTSYREQNGGRDPSADQLLQKLDDSAIALQYHYIKANPSPLGAKHKLNKALDSSRYSQSHERFHPTIRNYLERFGYYDIFLVQSKTGKVVYSVFKELDFATSLTNGPYTQSNFAEAFRLADAATSAGTFVITDFKQYLPSYEAPAAFVASPIFKGDKKLGVLIFQFPLDSLNNIMKERAGMGKSGETYLVGGDLLMRSDSFLDAQNHSVVASFRHPDK